MKTFLQLSLGALILLFGSCQKDPVGPKGGSGNNDCNVSGTLVRTICGTGVWGDLWIKLDDGSLLQPCELNTLHYYNAEEGQRINFSYTKLAPNAGCHEEVIRCMAAIPEAEKVSIDCISEGTTSKDCELEGTIIKDHCADGLWSDLVIKMDNGRLVIPIQSEIANFHPKEGQRVYFSYRTDPLFCGDVYPCETFAPVDFVPGIITCIKPCGGNGHNNDCNTLGTVRDFTGLSGCGLIIETDDGKKLEPVGFNFMDHNLKDGDRIKFGYRDSRAGSVCMVGQTVSITCMEKVDGGQGGNPCKPIYMHHGTGTTLPGYQHAAINNARLEGSQLYIDIAFSGCSDDNRDFQLIWDGSLRKSFPAQATLSLRDFNRPEMCQAYFMQTLCFDVSALQQIVRPGPSPIEFTIEGTNFTFKF